MLYTQLISYKNDDFIATVAHSEEETCKLIEAGFEFVCDFEANKLQKTQMKHPEQRTGNQKDPCISGLGGFEPLTKWRCHPLFPFC